MMSFEEKVDNATHAALEALGLTAENCPDTADLINDMLTDIARCVFVSEEEDE